MKPWRRPSAQMRVPATSRNSGVIEPGGRGHQAEGHDAVGKGVTRRAQHGKRRHVRAEERGQEDVGPHGAAREEVLLGAFVRAAMAEREDADVQHHREVGKDDDGRQHDGSVAIEMRGPDGARGTTSAPSTSA